MSGTNLSKVYIQAYNFLRIDEPVFDSERLQELEEDCKKLSTQIQDLQDENRRLQRIIEDLQDKQELEERLLEKKIEELAQTVKQLQESTKGLK